MVILYCFLFVSRCPFFYDVTIIINSKVFFFLFHHSGKRKHGRTITISPSFLSCCKLIFIWIIIHIVKQLKIKEGKSEWSPWHPTYHCYQFLSIFVVPLCIEIYIFYSSPNLFIQKIIFCSSTPCFFHMNILSWILFSCIVT